jgi:hypothetical protein
MTFKEFLQNEGLYGNVAKLNPSTIGHRIEKRLNTHPTTMRGTSVSRMLRSGPQVTTAPRPAGITLPGHQTTIASSMDRPKKPRINKSPLGIL